MDIDLPIPETITFMDVRENLIPQDVDFGLAFSRPANTLAFSQTLCSSLSMAIFATNLHFRLQPQISRYESPFLFLLCCEFFFPSSSSVVSALFVAFRLPFGCCSCFFSSSFSCSAMSVGHGGVFGHLSLSLLPSPIAVGGLGGEWAASSFFFFSVRTGQRQT
ncbi:hypothetical protein Cgig2_003723 [Carnegiea gigantea]|uniref:Transmembrane protein n=1 Tax=Carnegiea gigantea TaxID=171969 RepID=A0A9Q1QI49_9CARY|nr:hypothetical protein Cgig2_003723 [Carnegiea gigantea]